MFLDKAGANCSFVHDSDWLFVHAESYSRRPRCSRVDYPGGHEGRREAIQKASISFGMIDIAGLVKRASAGKSWEMFANVPRRSSMHWWSYVIRYLWWYHVHVDGSMKLHFVIYWNDQLHWSSDIEVLDRRICRSSKWESRASRFAEVEFYLGKSIWRWSTKTFEIDDEEDRNPKFTFNDQLRVIFRTNATKDEGSCWRR